jgi:hypothetical protein
VGRKTGSKVKLYPVLGWTGGREVSWPTYVEAVAMVRARGIKSRVEYIDYLRTYRVKYLPSNPNKVYLEWEGWPVFLGTNNVAKGIKDRTVYLSFWEAAAIVNRLGLSSGLEWKKYIRDNKLPPGVCKNPARVYKDIWNVTVGWEQWLGKCAGAVVEVARAVEDKQLWCIVCVQEDKRYFDIVKCGEREVPVGCIGKWRYEKEYEVWLWEYLELVSREENGRGNRYCDNIWQLIAGMNQTLLMVR